MLRRFPTLALLILLALPHTPARADDPASLQWLLPDLGEPLALQRFLAARMPNVQQAVSEATVVRIWMTLGKGEPACSNQIVRSKARESLMAFTPTMLTPPGVVVVRADDAPQLPRGADGGVDLGLLLSQRLLTGLGVKGRSYGDEVDAMIARMPPDSKLTLLQSLPSTNSSLQMLMLRRADYAIIHERDLYTLPPELGGPAKLRMLPISGASHMSQVGIACTPSPWGRAMIHQIDAALATPETARALRELVWPWIPKDVRERYGAQIEAFYRQRAQPMAVMPAP